MQQLREKLKKDLRIATLDDVADIIMGQSPPSASYNKDGAGLPFLQGKADFSNSKKYPIIRQWTSAPTKISESGSILFTVRAPVGELFYNNVKACIGRGLASISAKSNNSQEFLYQFLQSKKAEFDKLSQGSTFTAINSDALRKIKIAVPPLEEQKKIAEILSKVDEDIEKTNKITRKTENLKKGLTEKLLAKGKKIKLKEISEIKRGASPRPIGDKNYFSENGRGWIRISDVTRTYKYLNETKQYLSKLGEERSVAVNKGDLIMSICATVGKPIIINIPACIHDGFVLFSKINSKLLDTEFLFYALLNSESNFLGSGQTGSQKNLNTTIVGNTEINLPTLKMQQETVKILSKVDEKINIYKSIKSKLEILKKGLMQDLLSEQINDR